MKISTLPIACFALAWLATACADGLYNAGDPASDEWLETRILECLMDPDCPVPRMPSLALGSNTSSTILRRIDGSVRAWDVLYQ